MSILLRDSAEGSVCVREMIDTVYSLACHPLHSTRWLVDGTVLLKCLIQIWPQQVSERTMEGYHGIEVDLHCQ